jgi:NAD(P)H dehydrogenase (quinone)
MSEVILLAGASGVIGSAVLRELDGRAPLRALVHTRASRERVAHLHPSVELAVGDLAEVASVRRAFDGATRLFLLTPSVADQQRLEENALAAALAAGVERIVYVSNAEVGWGIELSRAHEAAERRLQSSGVAHTVLRPDYLLDNLLHEVEELARGRVVAPSGSGRCAFVDARDVAAVAAAALLADRPISGPLVLSGPEALSWAELAERLSAALGAPIGHEAPDPAEWARAAAAGGMPPWLAGALSEYFTRLQTHSITPSGDISRVTGREPRSVEEFARDRLVPALTPIHPMIATT